MSEDTLSLVKKLGIVETVGVFDVQTVMEWAAVDVGLLTLEDAESVIASQFRSFEFTPLVALWIHNGWDSPMQLTDVADLVKEPSSLIWGLIVSAIARPPCYMRIWRRLGRTLR